MTPVNWRDKPRGPLKKATRNAPICPHVSDDGFRVMAQLRTARVAAGLTQAQVGQRAGLGRQRIADYEHGRYEPSVGNAVRIAKAIGLTRFELNPTDGEAS